MTSVGALPYFRTHGLVPRDEPIDRSGVTGPHIAQAGKDIDLLPDQAQIVLGRSAWATRELLPSGYHLRGNNQSVDICGFEHGATIAERAGLVNPVAMSVFARILAIAGILGIVLSLVLIVRPLFG